MQFDPHLLSYSPRSSWQMNHPKIYFNREFLCEGEPFKVRVDDPYHNLRGATVLRIESVSDLQAAGSEPFVREVRLLKRVEPRYLFAASTGTEGRLSPGAYRAVISTGLTGLELESNTLAEFPFYVAGTKEYFDQWNYLFGDTWDEPLFWDELEPADVSDLLSGLPLDELFAIFRAEIEWSQKTLFQFLGPLLTAFMMNGFRDENPLPFAVDYVGEPDDLEEVPHLDLTKLMWLLNLLGPFLADVAFFSHQVILGAKANSDGLFVQMNWHGPYPYEWDYDLNNIRNFYIRPPMFDLANETIRSEINYQIEYELNELKLAIFSDERPRPKPSPALEKVR